MNPIPDLIIKDSQPFVDSRTIAKKLGLTPRYTFRQILKHQTDFEDLDQLRFKNSVGDRSQGGGNPEKYILLSEDQAVFLLTLSKNTPKVIKLKKHLSKQFVAFRNQILKKAREAEQRGRIEWQQARFEGREERRELTDAIQKLVEFAKKSGSKNADWYYHSISKLIYFQLFGARQAPSNFRDTLDQQALKRLRMVEWEVAGWIMDALETCSNYHHPYDEIKKKLKVLVKAIGRPNLHREIE